MAQPLLSTSVELSFSLVLPERVAVVGIAPSAAAILPPINFEGLDMLVQITDWRNYYQDGEQFLRTATSGQSIRPEIFTPEILYNVITMAIEKFIMGFLMYHGDLADNHTMADMIRSMERHLELPPALARDLLHLDSFQEICDMDSYTITPPTRDQIDEMLAVASETRKFIAGRIGL